MSFRLLKFMLLSGLVFAGGCTPAEKRVEDKAGEVWLASERIVGPLADVIAGIDAARNVAEHNLRHVDTYGFKATRYHVRGDGSAEQELDLEQGSLENTGKPLDVAIQGEGFFRVKVPMGSGSVIGFTRNGNLLVNNEGYLVLGTGDGYTLDPPIAIPSGTTDIHISPDGMVRTNFPGATAITHVGQLTITRFPRPEKLKAHGPSLYLASDESGKQTDCKPQENGAGQILQGFREKSNVDITREKMRLEFLTHWRAVLMK